MCSEFVHVSDQTVNHEVYCRFTLKAGNHLIFFNISANVMPEYGYQNDTFSQYLVIHISMFLYKIQCWMLSKHKLYKNFAEIKQSKIGKSGPDWSKNE